MKRRCRFLDNLPAFNYNRGTGRGEYKGEPANLRQLGSTLMEAMLREVAEFCNPTHRESWTQEAHEQVLTSSSFFVMYDTWLSTQPTSKPV